MYSSKGSHFNSTTKNMKGSGSDFPTAVKSFYHQASPTHPDISQKLRSPSKYSGQFRGVRESIDVIIDDVSEKNKTANYGVLRVGDANQDAMRYLENNSHMASTPKRTTFQKDYRTEGMKQTSPTACLSPSQFDGGFGSRSVKGPLKADSYSQNSELKKLLSDEVRRNRELMRELSVLKSENANLKMGSPTNAASKIYEELDELKRENERLRQDTIRLLNQHHH